uniref:Uncharacterized protein n=1 Tax=Arundo donax TaxID=35708 RepID=A0A0A9E3T2_ARUDO
MGGRGGSSWCSGCGAQRQRPAWDPMPVTRLVSRC